jgi:hypothetical protein
MSIDISYFKDIFQFITLKKNLSINLSTESVCEIQKINLFVIIACNN